MWQQIHGVFLRLGESSQSFGILNDHEVYFPQCLHVTQMISIINHKWTSALFLQYQMKEAKELKCELHNLPVLKIEMHSKKLLCEKCTTEPDQQRKQRLELHRIKIHKHYQISLQELKTVKERTDKLVQLFQSRNMSEAKKIINKSSSEVQKIVQSLLQREVKQANKCLKQTAEKQLQYWKIIDGRTFCSTYLQFEQQYQKIQQRLNALKQNLKQQICDKMKVEIRNYYCSLFEF